MKKHIFLFVCLLFISIATFGQSEEYVAAQAKANTYINAKKLIYDSKKNIYTDKNNTIHIFIFEDGNLLTAGYPTTATEKNKFQLHMLAAHSFGNHYLVEYTGSYSPTMNIQGSGDDNMKVGASQGSGPEITQTDFAVLGPFSGSVTLTLKVDKGPNTGGYTTLVSTTVQIAKTVYASIGSGIVVSWLKNPGNIRSGTATNGDPTLIADNPNQRTLTVVMATFYPWTRNNLMIPSWSFKDRFGIVVGTGVSTFSDVLLGGQYDFAIGGSIVAGIHYGRTTKISGLDYKTFKFGQTKYTGDIAASQYTDTGVGLFVGIQLDSRIFSQFISKAKP